MQICKGGGGGGGGGGGRFQQYKVQAFKVKDFDRLSG